jgi:hypothetical protein
VSDLQVGFSADDLKKLFSTCGHIEFVLFPTPDSAYIVFDSAEVAQCASDTIDGELFDGIAITVKRCPSEKGRELEAMIQQMQIESSLDVGSSDVSQLCDQLSQLSPNELKTICVFLSTHLGDKEASSAAAPVNTQDPKSISQSIVPPLCIPPDPLSSGSVPHQPDYSGMVSQNHVPTTPVDQQIPPGSIPSNSFSHKQSVPPGFVPLTYQFTPQQPAPSGVFQYNAMQFGSIPQPSVPLRPVPPNHPIPGLVSQPMTTSGSGPSQNNRYGSVPFVSNHSGFYGQPPRVSQFSGQDQKGDVSFDLWRSEISGLMDAGYPEPVLLHAVRKSLKGRAADMLLNMGSQVTLNQLILKFQQVFGIVCTPQLLLEKFYNSNQNFDESVSSWACKLEDILRMLQDHGYACGDQRDSMLRSKFWTGLCRSSVKNGIRHLYDSQSPYADLVVAARLVEQEESSPTVVSQQISTPKSEYAEILMEISKLHKRLNDIESKQRSSSRRSTFKGKCYQCGSVGHRKVDCTSSGNE